MQVHNARAAATANQFEIGPAQFLSPKFETCSQTRPRHSLKDQKSYLNSFKMWDFLRWIRIVERWSCMKTCAWLEQRFAMRIV